MKQLSKWLSALTFISAIHSSAEVGSVLNLPSQAVGAVRCGTGFDSVLVNLPSRGSGKILESETFKFETKLIIAGPLKPVEVDVKGVITLRIQSFTDRRVVVEGNLSFINPYLSHRQHLIEKLESIQALGSPIYAAFIYLNDRLRLPGELTSEQESSRKDNPVKLSSFGGEIFCAPVIESQQKSVQMKEIQGLPFHL